MFMTSLWGGCKSEAKKTYSLPLYYFDLKSYFEGEANRLSSSNIMVDKSVSKNNDVEKKEIIIKDWTNELSSFINSDINKTAWKESYVKDSTVNKISYFAKYPDLKTRSIVLNIKDHKPSCIKIINHQKNYLIENIESLIYYPDSVYKIKKTQRFIFLDNQVYYIVGKFNKGAVKPPPN